MKSKNKQFTTLQASEMKEIKAGATGTIIIVDQSGKRYGISVGTQQTASELGGDTELTVGIETPGLSKKVIVIIGVPAE